MVEFTPTHPEDYPNPQTCAIEAARHYANQTRHEHGKERIVNAVVPTPQHLAMIRREAPSAGEMLPIASVTWHRHTEGAPWYFVRYADTNGPLLPQVHNLKCHPEYFEEIWTGAKPFEIRFDDRGFQEGDTLILHEWRGSYVEHSYDARAYHGDREEKYEAAYTGRKAQALVTYLLRAEAARLAGIPGLQPGWVVMGIELQ